jgi:hypothetical protein
MKSLILALFMIGLVGCSSAPSGEPNAIIKSVVPLSGKVTYGDGQPVSKVTIIFNAKSPPGNDANAVTEADGSFKLGTFSKEDGLIPGKYVVTFEQGTTQMPKRYKNVSTSPLVVEVTSETKNLNFVLK